MIYAIIYGAAAVITLGILIFALMGTSPEDRTEKPLACLLVFMYTILWPLFWAFVGWYFFTDHSNSESKIEGL